MTTTKLDEKALLPCPFCGGPAKYRQDHTVERIDTVSCLQCDFYLSDPDDTGSCVAAWNRRTLPAAPAGGRVTDALLAAEAERDTLAALLKEAREVLEPFAEAAVILEREYGSLLLPETGCSIRFSALVASRAFLDKTGDARAALEQEGGDG